MNTEDECVDEVFFCQKAVFSELCVVVDSLISAAKVYDCVISDGVDRQNSDMWFCGRAVALLKINVSSVFSLGDCALVNQFSNQEN